MKNKRIMREIIIILLTTLTLLVMFGCEKEIVETPQQVVNVNYFKIKTQHYDHNPKIVIETEAYLCGVGTIVITKDTITSGEDYIFELTLVPNDNCRYDYKSTYKYLDNIYDDYAENTQISLYFDTVIVCGSNEKLTHAIFYSMYIQKYYVSIREY